VSVWRRFAILAVIGIPVQAQQQSGSPNNPEALKQLSVEELSQLQITSVTKAPASAFKTLSDLLAYSEMAGSADRPAEIVDTRAVIAGALEVRKVRLEQAGALVVVGDMPMLRAHQNRITSLFQNFIENTNKYRSEAAPVIPISMVCGTGKTHEQT